MAQLKIDQIRKSFGKTDVLKGVDLDIADGEFIVLLGASGCGKSTLLRIIAGLETQTSGRISIGGQAVDQLPPARRGIAMVFQSYALYPHLDVAGNWALGLKQAGESAALIAERTKEAARILALDSLLQRKPSELSGGQRQRVAIGRAIVRHPKVFLFDEPLSNLDAALRSSVRFEIARLHKQLGATMVYVTHDQVEAMTLADRIVVMDKGIVQQVGTPEELYRRPANLFVAGFIGSPKMNFLEGQLTGSGEIQLERRRQPRHRRRADAGRQRARSWSASGPMASRSPSPARPRCAAGSCSTNISAANPTCISTWRTAARPWSRYRPTCTCPPARASASPSSRGPRICSATADQRRLAA